MKGKERRFRMGRGVSESEREGRERKGRGNKRGV